MSIIWPIHFVSTLYDSGSVSCIRSSLKEQVSAHKTLAAVSSSVNHSRQLNNAVGKHMIQVGTLVVRFVVMIVYPAAPFGS